MHELSIVNDLLARIDEVAAENRATRVARVVVGVGRLAGISPQTLEQAFEQLKLQTIVETAELVTETEEVRLRCQACQDERLLSESSLRCSRCGSSLFADHDHRRDLWSPEAIACPHCGEVVEGWMSPCPRCGSSDVRISAGRSIVLKSVELAP